MSIGFKKPNFLRYKGVFTATDSANCSYLKLELVSTSIPAYIFIEIYVCTLTAVDFYSHCYVIVPPYRQYPDEVRCDWLNEFIVSNRDSVFISAKHLPIKRKRN